MQAGLFCSHFAQMGRGPVGNHRQKRGDDLANVAEFVKPAMPRLVTVENAPVGDGVD